MTALRVRFYTNLCHEAGTYFRFHNLAVGLRRRGHDVEVFAGDLDARARARREVRDEVPYVVHPASRWTRLTGIAFDPVGALRRAARRPPPADVVHLFQPFVGGALPWGRAARRAPCRMFDWDDLWVGGALGPARGVRQRLARASIGALEARLPRYAHGVTTCSRFLADLARDRGARHVAVVPNGCWPAPRESRADARRHFGLPEGALYAGFMGRTTGELAWCVDALSALGADDVRLAVCGPPPGALEALDARMRGRIDHLGELTALEAARFARAIDLGLVPLADTPFNRSRFPIKVADHLAGGAPILLSAVGDCAALTADLPFVLQCAPGRDAWIAGFVHAVERLRTGRMPAVDQGLVEARLGWDQACGRLEDAYRALLA